MGKRKKCKVEPWKLLYGSHEFPGPDGGTCINEAAVVARGFEYREISGPEDFPPCFSPVVGVFAMKLNDCISDDAVRTRLLSPFVPRLAGTKSRASVEIKRAKFILAQIARLDELPGLATFQDDYPPSDVQDWDEARRVVAILDKPLKKWSDADMWFMLELTGSGGEPVLGSVDQAVKTVSEVTDGYFTTAAAAAGVEILDKAIKMGRHAKIADIRTINRRLREYKRNGDS